MPETKTAVIRLSGVNEKTTVLNALKKENIDLSAACAGNGTCGKCKVQIIHNIPEPGSHDMRCLSPEELKKGFRLACAAYAAEGMEIRIRPEGFDILDTYAVQRKCSDKAGEDGYFLAVDIGTTTVVFELVTGSGRRVCSHTLLNRQRNSGADVITRIKKASEGEQEILHTYIMEDLRQGITHVLNAASINAEALKAVGIAGNTTMLHIFRNFPCESLGRFPFTPVSIRMEQFSFHEIFGQKEGFDLSNCSVYILPGISAFVGADISAGILFCGGLETKEPCLLIDLGTNGEMALFDRNRITVTSTAAGPAFEAGNISHGMGSIPGAIAKVRYRPENCVYIYETIDNIMPPAGICGTGVVDAAAELVRHGIADETGLLDDEFFEEGVEIAAGIRFTQKDMREVQLAKSAVRSGIELLLKNAGYACEDIRRVFIAGGFGYKIDLENAEILGIIPAAFRGKISAVGNSALGGCVQMLLDDSFKAEIRAIAEKAEEINLSADPGFNDLFMEHIMFV